MSWRDYKDKKKKNILEENDNRQNQQKFVPKKETSEETKSRNIITNNQQSMSTWDKVQGKLASSSIGQERLKNTRNLSVTNTQPITQVETKKENPNSKLNNFAYLGKKTVAGLFGGITGLGQTAVTETASQLKKGEKENTGKAVTNLAKKMLLPDSVNMIDATKETVKGNINILKDKDKNAIQKIVGIGQNSVSGAINTLPFKQKTNAVIQTIGNILKDKQTSNTALEVNKAISQPSQNFNQQLAKESERYGKPTQFLGDAMQSVGNMVPSIATTMITGDPSAGLLTMGLSAKGSSTNEALNKGVELEDAVKRGDTDAMIEVGTEMLTGGVNIFGKGALDDLVQNGIVKNVKNEVARYFVQQGVNIGGEVLEETISDVLGTILDKGTTDPNASYSLKDWGKTALTTTLSTVVLNALTGGLVGDVRLAQNRNELRNQVSESNLTDSQKENISNKIQDERITNQEELQNEIQKLDIIENSGLDEERKASLLRVADKNNLDLDQISSLIEADQERYGIEQTTMQNNEVLNQEQQTIQDESKMAQNETSQQQRDLIQDLQKFNETRQEGQEIFDLDNEENVKEVQAIQKVAEKRGINITFDESRFDNTDTNAFYEYDEKGNVANIVLNPNSTSKKYVQNLVIHEMTHSFEGSKQYDSLSKAILDYAKSKGEYDKAFDDLMNTYSKVYSGENLNKIVEKEAVANILGEKLGDKEFVESLVNNQYVERSTIQKIIDFVKNQINRFKGYKDQEQYWNYIKTLYEDAYNKSKVSQEGLKASVERNNRIKDSNKSSFSLEEINSKINSDSDINKLTDDGITMTFVHMNNQNTQNYGSQYGQNIEPAGEYMSMDTLQGESKVPNAEYGTIHFDNPLILDHISTDSNGWKKTLSEMFGNKTGKSLSNAIKKAGYDAIMTVDENGNYSEIVNLDGNKNINKQYSQDTTDSQGRELSKGQQEYFKDSKVRDENGNLLEVYHGTGETFTKFEKEMIGSNYFQDEQGFFFTDDIKQAEEYADYTNYGMPRQKKGNVMKTFLNITNPYVVEIDYDPIGYWDENYENILQKANQNQNDGVIIKAKKYQSMYVAFEPNQIKNVDNLNPTSNEDIRYSKDTTGAWNNFIEKYFKNEGTGTAIKDMKKLPTREYTIQDYEEVINNSANIPEADKTAILKDLEGIELNKQSLNDFKQYVEDLDNNYKEVAQEKEQQRFENKNYKDEGRANLISEKRKEFNTNMEYDDSVVAELDEIIPRNKNGKRTVAQWKDMAKQLGQRIANLSPEQIEDIAVKSYYDLEPTKAITRYDNKSKTNVGYEQLYANDWVNEVYEGVRENRQFSMETENQENQPTQKELPKAETQLPTRDTSLEEDIEAFRQETRKVTDKTKGRKHLETYATSESVGKEGRKVARELYKSEQYVPISNRETMTKANTKIQTGGVENTYTELTNRFKTNEKMTLQDIATGERLIQIYSAQGDYAKVNELMQDVAILGTELGQQVQALSIIKKASPEGQLQLLNRLVERTNNKQNTDIKITDEQAEKILKSKNKEELDNNVSEVTLELAQQLPITMKDKIRSWRYLSMLGNPRTHIRNIVGNVAMNVLQNTKNKVAGAGEDIASIFNKNFERTKTFKGATKEQKAYAKADSYIMENVLENGGKYSAETLLDQNKRQFDNKILNKIADINSNLLEKEDTVFLRIAYRQALQGYMSANKITAQEMENNPKVANKARQYAIEQAQEATFHQFNALASTLNQIEEKGGVAGTLTSAILPFKKTPLNIAKTGIEYSPINIMRAVGGTISDITQTNKDLQSQLNKGKITQEEYNSEISSIVNNRIDQMAKGLTGTALGVLGYALSKMGVLKATNKDDEDEFEESLGKQEFSIQIGDNTYSLDWLAPTAIPLFIGANIQELFNETGKELNEEGEEKTFYDRVGDTLNTTVTGLTQAFEPMTEMSMLQGLASALSSYEQDSTNKIFDIGASALQSYAGQFVPTALGQVAKTIDPVVRDTSSTKKGFAKKVDQLKRQTTAKIPFVSKTLPSKSDVWGEEKTRADNILQRFVETAVLPYNREKVIDDMTSEQLKDIFRETGQAGALPKNPQKYFTVNKQKYNLTSEEYNNAKKIYGKTAKTVLDDITKTQQYKELDKDVKVQLLKDIYSYAKEEIKVDYLNKKKVDYEPKINNSAKKYKTIQTYKQNKNIEELLKLYNKE